MTKLKKEVGSAVLRPGYALAGALAIYGALALGAYEAAGLIGPDVLAEAPCFSPKVTEDLRPGYGVTMVDRPALFRTFEIHDGTAHALATFAHEATTFNGDVIIHGSLRVIDEQGHDRFKVVAP